MKRFSKLYAIDPKNRNAGGHEYAPLYPDELTHPIFEELGISVEGYEKARLKLLGAAFMYENHKQNVLERQGTPAERHKLHIDIAKKADKLAKAYSKLNIMGFTWMVATAKKQDPSIPDELELPDPNAIAFLAHIAAKAASIEDPINHPYMPHFAPSHPHYLWLMNVAPLFKGSKVELSVGSYHVDGPARALDILFALMHPLDPDVTTGQLAEAVKQYLKESGIGRLRRKSNRNG